MIRAAIGRHLGLRADPELLYLAAILHAAVGIANTREPEIALVRYGAGFDVIGVAPAMCSAQPPAAAAPGEVGPRTLSPSRRAAASPRSMS